MRKEPIITFLLCTICVVLFLAIPENVKESLLTSPEKILSLQPLEWAKALLASLLHYDFAHLFGNLLLISLIGYALEDRLGHLAFLKLLGYSVVGSLVLHVGLFPSSPVPFLGASVYAFGIVTAYCFLSCSSILKVLPIAILSILLYQQWQEGMQMYIGQALGLINGGVAHWAHIGGACGAIIFVCSRPQAKH